MNMGLDPKTNSHLMEKQYDGKTQVFKISTYCGLRETGVHKKHGGAQDTTRRLTITIYWR